MSNVTLDLTSGVDGSAHVNTKRRGAVLSSITPTTSEAEPSARRCSQLEPTCRSDTLLWPQYCRESSGSVIADHTFSGVLSI
nr:hypothetical protein [Kibdelosporangium aridum]